MFFYIAERPKFFRRKDGRVEGNLKTFVINLNKRGFQRDSRTSNGRVRE